MHHLWEHSKTMLETMLSPSIQRLDSMHIERCACSRSSSFVEYVVGTFFGLLCVEAHTYRVFYTELTVSIWFCREDWLCFILCQPFKSRALYPRTHSNVESFLSSPSVRSFGFAKEYSSNRLISKIVAREVL